MRELPLAFSYLKGRPTRSIMTILSIVIGVMIMFGLNGLSPAIKELFVSSTQAVALTEVDLYVTREDGSFFPQGYVREVNGVDGVVSTAAMVIQGVPVPGDYYDLPDDVDVNTIQVYGIDTSVTDDAFDVVNAAGRRLAAGRSLEPGDRGEVALISEEFAAWLGVGVGDTIKLPGASGWTPFEIVGLLDDPGLLLGSQQVFMPLETAQAFLNKPSRVNLILGRYAEGSDAQAIDAEVRSLFSRGYELAPLEGGEDIWQALLEFMNVIFTTFGLLSLAMAGLIMFNTFRTSVLERRTDIGLLRAVGARRGVVMRVILYEGLILAVLGTALGIAAGFGFAYFAKSGLNDVWEQGLGSSLGQPRFGALAWIVSLAFGLGIPLVSVLAPARGASRITPLEAMRPLTVSEEARVRRSRAIVGGICAALGAGGLASGVFPLMALGMLIFLLALGLLGPLLITPVTSFFSRVLVLIFGQEGGLAAGNIARQPRRAAITTTSLMVALAILIGLGGMLASSYGGATHFLENSLRSDYFMMAGSLVVTNDTVGAGPDLADKVRDIPGVADLTTLRQNDIFNADGIGIRLMGIDPAGYSRIAGLTFLEGDASAFQRLASGTEVIVNGRYVSQFGVKVGDTITLDGDRGPVSVQIAAVGLDYLNIKLPTVYMDQTSLAREFGIHNDVFLLINSEPDADQEQLEEDLLAVAAAYPGFGVLSHDELMDMAMQLRQAGVIGMNLVLALLAAPALLGLANAMGINVIERTREIGMLRAVGARRRQVRRMIVAESLLLSLMGIALGALSGILLSYVMTGVLEFAGLNLPYSFPVVGVITAICVGLLCGILAALIPARRASDLQIIAALAYE